MNLEEKFTSLINQDPTFQDVLKIVRENSQGKLWVVGGYLSRNLASILYGTGEPKEADFDFVVEKLNETISVPPSWEILKNKYGTPRLKKGEIEIDPIPLTDVRSIKMRGLKPTIENWLTGTPLTIQSFCYEMERGKIIGDIGLNSLLSKTIGVNNRESAENSARQKGKTVEEMIDRVANSFQFEKVL